MKSLSIKLMLLLCCGFLASCNGNDELTDNLLPEGKYPIEFSSSMYGLTTRATVNNTWEGGEQVAVSITGAYSVPFTAAADGSLTPNTPIYWQTATQSITVRAWYPALWSMKADQSTEANYKAADFIFAPTTTITYADRNTTNLTFSHKMAKVTTNLIAGTGVTDLSGATVSFYGHSTGLINSANGTIGPGTAAWVTPFASGTNEYTALLIPQDMTGKQFIRVTLGGGEYFYAPTGTDADLQAGKAHTYNITIHKTGLTVTATIADWTSGGTVNGEAKLPPSTIDLTAQVGDYTATKNCIIDGKGQSLDKKIVIAAGVEVILKDVILTPTTNGNGITCKGNATITLQGSNDVKGYNADVFSEYCGILVEAGSMIIDGADDTYLTATGGGGGGYGAGIGATNSANITINGGNITAQASYGSAGIGSAGWDHTCGDITITRGIINAIAENYAAGIGGSNPGNCGNILITGGNIQAKGGIASPGIGSGTDASCGTIDITGEAVVVATKGLGALVSIGHSLFGGSCGVVTIMSPNVTQN